jgi:UDP-N-acetyl-D-mannosaminuronic acid dehydrogenase
MENVVIVGGCGHVGLPLGIALAHEGKNVLALDIDQKKVDLVNSGKLPFIEDGGESILQEVLTKKLFMATTSTEVISDCHFVVVIVGTPVDEHLNPDPEAIVRVLEEIKPYLNPSQLLILRSTVFPGVTARVEKWCEINVPGLRVSFCPERIAEGKAMTELYTLPQIIGTRSADTYEKVSQLFSCLTSNLIFSSPEEAELAKLFTNVWRYIKFATVNQFFMMANDFGVDFERVRDALTFEYPRAADMPSAGFSAGPCLLKDTMQLGAFSNNSFALGHSAMLINEGLPLYIVQKLKNKYDLGNLKIGILGMTFKPDVDDNRSSLSYKLRKILRFQAKEVLCTDPYLKDPTFLSFDYVVQNSDILIIGAPHKEFVNLNTSKPVIDIWNMFGNGVLI